MPIEAAIARPIHSFFRFIGGLLLAAGALGAGFLERAPTVIIAVAAAWAVAKIATSWRGWSSAEAEGESTSIARHLGTTLALQTTYVGVLYGVGRWLGTFSTVELPANQFGGFDWFLLALLMLVAVPLRVFGGSAVAFAAEAAVSGG